MLIDIAGSVFYEGEETVKQLKTLYKEDPNISLAIYEKGKTRGAPIATQALTVSHYFEFSGLRVGKEYEVIVTTNRPAVDRRHKSTASFSVKGDQSSFTKFIIPLRTSI